MEQTEKGEGKTLFIARFPYMNSENPDICPWFQRTVEQAKRHPAIGSAERVLHCHFDDTPITMTRNLAVRVAREHKADFLLMIDNDIRPDMVCNGGRNFFESSLDFLLSQEQPAVVVAPYCGPPPQSLVYVFDWMAMQNPEDMTVPAWGLEMIPRTEAARRVGFSEVGAGPTGLILIDLRVFEEGRGLEEPYFDYEWQDRSQTVKATTEDVYFTRNLSLLGREFNGGVWCNWDTWCGHHKRLVVPKPRPIFVEEIREQYRNAVKNGLRRSEVIEQVEVVDGRIVRRNDSLVRKHLEKEKAREQEKFATTPRHRIPNGRAAAARTGNGYDALHRGGDAISEEEWERRGRLGFGKTTGRTDGLMGELTPGHTAESLQPALTP